MARPTRALPVVMRRMRRAFLAALVALLCGAPTRPVGADPPGRPAPPLPREASRWLGEPTSWDALRGRVTLVFVWTFG
jgi:hypothetical protein